MIRVLVGTTLAISASAVVAFAQGNYRNMDRNGDGEITRSEWRGSVRDFRKRDWNRDGVLSGDEITGNRGNNYSVNGSGNRSSSHEYRPSSSGRRALGRLDKNDSGAVEGYEWPYNASVFHKLDTNKDSVLEPNELTNITSVTLQELDSNHNGRIEDDEWPGGFAKFDNLDQNRDGRIEATEYFQRGGEWQRRRRFDLWDTNQDSRLSMSEWKSSAKLFRELDRNRDGQVDWSEYMDSTDRYDRPFGWHR